MIIYIIIKLIIISLLLYIINKKETFQVTFSNTQNFSIKDDDDENTISEFIDVYDYYNKTVNTITFKMFNMTSNSIIRFFRNNDYDKNMTLGFYFKFESNNTGNKIMKIKNNDNDNEFMYLSNDNSNNLIIHFTNTDDKIIFNNGSDFLIDNINFLIIKINNEESTNKSIEINLNNIKNEKISFSNNSNLASKTIEFGSNFIGSIGNINIFNSDIDKTIFCNYYNCNISQIQGSCNFKLKDLDEQIKDEITNAPNPVNECISQCYKNNCDIELCQQICIDCQDGIDDGLSWDTDEKIEICPWYKDIIILDRSAPNPPIIRGFSKDGKIELEWKQPYNGRIEITHYIIEIINILNNNTKVSWIDETSKCDICNYTINNLENQIYYNISVRAVNSTLQGGGIGAKSNVITIAPNGQNKKLLKNILNDFNFSELDTMNTSIIKCNNNTNSDHILDIITNDEIDIHKIVKENN